MRERRRRQTTSRTSLLAQGLLVASGLILLLKWIDAFVASPEIFARGLDFGALLTGARLIRNGEGARLYDFAAQQAEQTALLADYAPRPETFPYNHPPFDALVGALLVELPYPAAYIVWTVGAILAVVAAVALLARVLPIPPTHRVLLLGGIASYPFLYSSLWLGQNTPFVLLGLCGAFAALRLGRPHWAGVALSLVALKPQLLLLILLLLLLQRQWRTLATSAAILTTGTVAVMPLLGPLWPLHYLRLLVTLASWPTGEAIAPAGMPNWRGFTLAILGDRAPGLVMPLVVLLTLATTGWWVWCWWRSRQRGAGDETLWALTIVTMLLIMHHLNPHELTLLIFGAWVIVAAAGTQAVPRHWLFFLWGSYAARWLVLLPGHPATATVPTVLLLVLAAFLLGRQLATPRQLSDVWLPGSEAPPAALANFPRSGASVTS